MQHHIDTLITAQWLLPMGQGYMPRQDAGLAIHQGMIVAVGRTAELVATYTADQTYHLEHSVLLPGLINLHGHAGMTWMRGMCIQQASLASWLNGCVLPIEKAHIDPELVYYASAHGFLELLKGGVTTVLDMYFHQATVARLAQEMGMRALLGLTMTDAWPEDELDALREVTRGSDMVFPLVAPHSLTSASPEVLQMASDYAYRHGMGIVLHYAETVSERSYLPRMTGSDMVKALYTFGMDRVPVIAAHAIYTTEQEQDALARMGNVGVVYNPSSNMFLGSGVMPVSAYEAVGVPIALGTDSAVSNNRLDMWHEMHVGWLLQRLMGCPVMHPGGRPTGSRSVTPEHMLAMATRVGAQVARLPQVGMLIPGMRADVIALDLQGLHVQPAQQDIYARLVCAARANDVTHVMINGNMRIINRQLTPDLIALERRVRTYESEVVYRMRSTHD